ncbi:HAMP domain-containing sensor histidine kinase [Prosthecobacter sp.]|uniref:sensor histidine kinase n=1 Tax=Prosthecobacter sp. TaxID=1965333 RepID=UPI00248A76D1|nr:HAMP domain-containing sensor histidine kinase [Prosthecobacter sp.]MDI1311299.1 HAMP domain-containing sensor histidine kinase [Prosthecobacter sp.]
MSLTKSQQYASLSDHFATRRAAILEAWRKADRADPDQTTGRSLTVSQFFDHIPEMLDAFEYRLRSRPGGIDAQSADGDKKDEGVKHGLHRWQQGYRLRELINECGHLQVSLFNEMEKVVAEHPYFERAVLVEANRQIMELVNDMISESAGQYERMQQAESAGHVGDLMGALASVNEIEKRRATLIHQAVHDLNSDVVGVSLAASLLGRTEIAEPDRLEFATMLQRGVSGLSSMLGDLMELARLGAGQEKRRIAPFNAATLLTERCDLNEPFAKERHLFMEVNGPASLEVEGDADKVGRLLQNLLMNALKYTPTGGVSVTWGEEKENWWLMVKDTGPGLHSRASAPLIAGLQEATASAKEADEKSTAIKGEVSNVLPPPWDAAEQFHPPKHQPGEGIGLSIVKRMCELLDASLEIASSAETGTTFRVVFPRRYRSAPQVPSP